MNLRHHGNWRVVGQFADSAATSALTAAIYECPLCFSLVLDPLSHGEFHQWTGTEHPYSPRGRS